MTASEFRRVALSLPEAEESAHMGHPDFRVRGKIFASLGYPDGAHAMLILPVEEQARLVGANPDAFAPAAGAWGRNGATAVRLSAADADAVENAIAIAWCKRAPKRLLQKHSAA